MHVFNKEHLFYTRNKAEAAEPEYRSCIKLHFFRMSGAIVRTIAMRGISFIELQELCELNLDKQHVSCAFGTINNSDCLFFSGIIMPQKHIASLYKLRFENAKERSLLDQEYLSDYEKTVANLNTSRSENLGLAGVYSIKNDFLIFFEPDTKKILGILKSKPNDHTLEMVANPNKVSSFGKYSKGILVEQSN